MRIQQLVKAVSPKADPRFVAALTEEADKAAARFGITDDAVLVRFLAQNDHETNGFRDFTEKMNYSAKRLTQVWPSRFRTLAAAAPYANNPPKLANNVYANRMGNGGPETGDGWRFRGGGATHHTGAAEYARVKKRTGHDPDIIRNPANAVAIIEAAASYWQDRNVIEAARRCDDRTSTCRVNGGLIGYEDRLIKVRRYEAAAARLPIPRERTRKETSQRQKAQGVAAASGAGTTGTATVTAPAAATPEAPMSPWLIGGGVLLVAALVTVAVVLIRKARKTETVLETERQTIIDMRATQEA